MMPPQQETTITPNIPATPNRPENNSVHAEPAAAASSTNDVIKPTLDNDIIPSHHQQQQQAPSTRLSILHQSLRPVTLKVYKFFHYLFLSLLLFFFSLFFFSLYDGINTDFLMIKLITRLFLIRKLHIFLLYVKFYIFLCMPSQIFTKIWKKKP